MRRFNISESFLGKGTAGRGFRVMGFQAGLKVYRIFFWSSTIRMGLFLMGIFFLFLTRASDSSLIPGLRDITAFDWLSWSVVLPSETRFMNISLDRPCKPSKKRKQGSIRNLAWSPSEVARFFSYSGLSPQEIFDWFESLDTSQSWIVLIASSEVWADLRL